ncbi:hypothetical protein [Clostridium fallax]|uniref:Uncharacterized protein n=1 Tax=Clostridium fallax TaxID=1533 RepID=A0A1M4UXX1_9CLOT|nr:hypothetical protein [Clostridium fallax]SHE61487.1 hypothetical protein SAMN05443638_10650 [Clostridium fallax]SQB06748.1 Uncharacterised protein [Clostridium fallax]
MNLKDTINQLEDIKENNDLVDNKKALKKAITILKIVSKVYEELLAILMILIVFGFLYLIACRVYK